jgi:type IV pilus assembly protein PilC
MAEFHYQGVDKTGKKVSGKQEASGDGELRMFLREQGIRPTMIRKGDAIGASLGSLMGSGVTVPMDQLVGFTRQLQVLIGSGIPLVQGLEILLDQVARGSLRNIIMNVREKISSGAYLWESLSAYPQVFPKLYIALVRAGEASGAMDQMLKRVSRYLEDSDRMRKILKAAMMYPIIVMSIAVGVVALMLIFVIPKFEEMLKSSGQSLPGPTQFVIDASHFLQANYPYVIVGGVLLYYISKKYFSSPEGRAVLHRTLFTIPMFGTMMQKAGIARFSRTMQTLLSSGVNLIDAIDICKSTIDNVVLEEAVATIKAEVESGKTLGMVISRLTVFPKMAVQMIAVGESTGNLDKMLEKVADFYEAEVETLVNGLTKLIEPIILVFLGGIVGGILIAMYLPIFKLAGGVD